MINYLLFFYEKELEISLSSADVKIVEKLNFQQGSVKMNVQQLKFFLEKLFESLDQNGKVVLFNSLMNVVFSESEMNSIERDNLSLKEKIDSLSEEYERLRSENTKLRSELHEANVILQMSKKVSGLK